MEFNIDIMIIFCILGILTAFTPFSVSKMTHCITNKEIGFNFLEFAFHILFFKTFLNFILLVVFFTFQFEFKTANEYFLTKRVLLSLGIDSDLLGPTSEYDLNSRHQRI